jgi:hypothetical protein
MTIYAIHTEWYRETDNKTRLVEIPSKAKHVTLYDRYVVYALDVTK